MSQTLSFLSFIVVWSLACSLAIGAVHPIAVFAVWLVGFVWGAGYIAAGSSQADLLLKRWFQMMVGTAILAGAMALFVS